MATILCELQVYSKLLKATAAKISGVNHLAKEGKMVWRAQGGQINYEENFVSKDFVSSPTTEKVINFKIVQLET